jgi:hypothetical protein
MGMPFLVSLLLFLLHPLVFSLLTHFPPFIIVSQFLLLF